VIAADFDRIALLPEGGFDHNSVYHRFLLRELGARPGHVLDLGCGSGAFTRLVATKATRVTGIDLSGNMIAAARRRSAGSPQIEFVQGRCPAVELAGGRIRRHCLDRHDASSAAR
jgi:ubiquinone/menaquinone biosynthesis C-methylase UbiE